MRTARLFTHLVDVLYPPRCAACDARLFSDTALCHACRESLLSVAETGCPRCARVTLDPPAGVGPHLCGPCIIDPPPYERIHAAWVYGAAIQDAIARWKNRPDPTLAGPLGKLLIEGLLESDTLAPSLDTIVVPVPSPRQRILMRGLNPAGVLAAEVAREFGQDLVPAALTLGEARDPSRGLSRRERATRMRGAFRASPAHVRGVPVVLVDDVVTTGATVTECARVLRAAGARRVEVIALARVPSP